MKLLSIGRSSDNDIVLTNSGVSKHHAQLIIEPNGVATIIDLESTNGTFVNGARISGPRTLHPHDVVKVGAVFLKWQDHIESQPPKPISSEKSAPLRKEIVATSPQDVKPTTTPATHDRAQLEERPRSQNTSTGSSKSLVLVIGIILGIILVGGAAIGIAVLSKGGMSSIASISDTYDLRVDCGDVENLLLASEVPLLLTNTGTRTHDNVQIQIDGFDKHGDNVISKRVDFSWTLGPNQSLPKVVTLPAKVRYCECKVLDSNPR